MDGQLIASAVVEGGSTTVHDEEVPAFLGSGERMVAVATLALNQLVAVLLIGAASSVTDDEHTIPTRGVWALGASLERRSHLVPNPEVDAEGVVFAKVPAVTTDIRSSVAGVAGLAGYGESLCGSEPTDGFRVLASLACTGASDTSKHGAGTAVSRSRSPSGATHPSGSTLSCWAAVPALTCFATCLHPSGAGRAAIPPASPTCVCAAATSGLCP
ncbi:MAG: hypothetical protein RMJ98_09010 [Myxococcales bacterium]|nr:hypothetical protein [Polyangiaceae bacterium]MDW8249425.1 hypothetical protein [Myxococcales bacterium]